MAHYAFLDENNIVTEVIVGIDETELIEGLDTETWYGNFRGQVCKRTSYHGNIRKNYAGIGMTYDEVRDAFIAPEPSHAIGFDEETCQWIVPDEALLCKAGQQLREQIDDAFPDRDRKSDGWIGDAAHSNRKSDHNPDPSNGIVRAIDVDKNLDTRAATGAYLADQIRECAKKDKRIAYVIYASRIASPKSFWRWRPYNGINRHDHHIHISFTKKGDSDSAFFQIPLLGA